MKILVTGVSGQLGYDVEKELKKRGHETVGTVHSEDGHHIKLDITDSDDVQSVIGREAPDAVVHCAAWTDVDAAEDSANREAVYLVNSEGTKNIALMCKKLDIKMIYISTDYVFDGKGAEPWKAESRSFGPLNVYGDSKLKGELIVSDILKKFYIVRISWVFGKNGKNFVKAIINAGKKHRSVRVISDQIGTPSYTVDIARLLADMVQTDKYGYYNVSNEGEYISWYDYACEIYKQAGISADIIPISTNDYGMTKAKRPLNSRFDRSVIEKNGFLPLPIWQDALRRFLEETKDQWGK